MKKVIFTLLLVASYSGLSYASLNLGQFYAEKKYEDTDLKSMVTLKCNYKSALDKASCHTLRLNGALKSRKFDDALQDSKKNKHFLFQAMRAQLGSGAFMFDQVMNEDQFYGYTNMLSNMYNSKSDEINAGGLGNKDVMAMLLEEQGGNDAYQDLVTIAMRANSVDSLLKQKKAAQAIEESQQLLSLLSKHYIGNTQTSLRPATAYESVFDLMYLDRMGHKKHFSILINQRKKVKSKVAEYENLVDVYIQYFQGKLSEKTVQATIAKLSDNASNPLIISQMYYMLASNVGYTAFMKYPQDYNDMSQVKIQIFDQFTSQESKLYAYYLSQAGQYLAEYNDYSSQYAKAFINWYAFSDLFIELPPLAYKGYSKTMEDFSVLRSGYVDYTKMSSKPAMLMMKIGNESKRVKFLNGVNFAA